MKEKSRIILPEKMQGSDRQKRKTVQTTMISKIVRLEREQSKTKKVDFSKLRSKRSMRKTANLYQINVKSRTQMMERGGVHDPKHTKDTENYVRDGKSHDEG